MTEGNPLYLREVLLAFAVDRSDAGMTAAGTFEVSDRLTELLGARLADLSEDGSAALELIAFGSPLPLDVLRDEVGEAVLLELERRSLATLDATAGRVVLDHPDIGEVVRGVARRARGRAPRSPSRR